MQSTLALGSESSQLQSSSPRQLTLLSLRTFLPHLQNATQAMTGGSRHTKDRGRAPRAKVLE